MTQKTTIKLLGFLASAALALSLAHTASAQTDWHWAGLDAGGVWSDPNNWLPEAGTTTFPPSVPPPADAPLLQRDAQVKRALQELKVPTVGARGGLSAATR